MPNDLTTKRNLLDAREDLRLESRRKLASSGFTASTWTLSGVVLVACGGAGKITDALCPNFDAAVLVSCGGGSPPSGERHYVQSSPVQGARLYFDMNNDKDIDADDIATQNGQYPEGFVTDANGEFAPIPLHLYGKSFVAYLDGAINAETGESFPGGTKYYSITHPSDEDDMPASDEGDQDTLFLPFHDLASPITDWIARQAELEGRVLTSRQVFEDVNDVIANFLGHVDYSTLAGDELTAFDLLYAAILNPANYEGNPAIEALSAYLATNPSLTDVRSNAQTLIATLTDTDLPTTLILLHADADTTSANMIDLPDVTIGTNAEAGAYIATVYAVRAGGVSYRMVDANDAEVSGGNFVVDSRTGVISVADGVTTLDAETTELYVQVTANADSTQTETVKIDVTVQSVITLDATAGTSGNVDENDAGAVAVMGIEASDTATATDFIISDVLGALSGYARMFEMEAATGATNTWNLKLKAGESLDYEAIRGGEIKLNVQVDTATHAPSDVLEFTITVTDDPMDITFSGDFGGEVIEDATDEDNLEGSVSGTITIANQPPGTTVTPADGRYGALSFDSGTWTYTLGVDANDVPLADEFLTKIQSLRTDEFLVDTATISVGTASKDIYVIIHGKNEVVGFVDATREAMDIEIGDTTALGGVNGFELGNVLSDFGVNLDGRLDDAATTVAFADSVSADLRTLFTLTERGDGVGTLTFTGDNAAALARGVSTIELAMIASTPQSTTEEIPPFMVQVNVANDEDNGDASYVIDENQAGTELSVALLDGLDANDDPDGVHADSVTMYQWFTIGGASDSTTKTNIGTPTTSATLDISSHTLPIGATYGVTITYTDNHDFANGETTEFDVLYFSVYFYNHPQDAIMVNENDADGVAPTGLPTVQAMGGAAIDSYRITSGNTGGKFAISNEGVITLASGETLDYDTDPTSYTLTILAEDANGSANSATVTINLTDINDNAPIFTQSTYTVDDVDETLENGDSVGLTVSATDADGTTANSTVTYSVTGGTGMGVFDVGPSSGVITVLDASMIDYESGTTSYTLEITASDGVAGTNDATTMVTINLDDINDNEPDIVVANASPTVTAQTASGDTDIITDITVTDADRGKTYAQGDFALTGDSKFKFVWDATAQSGKVVLIDEQEITADTINLSLTVTDAMPVGHTGTDTQALTITVEAATLPEDNMMNSPAQIPSHQEQAHQDHYDPDDLGLTPIPDADPSAS